MVESDVLVVDQCTSCYVAMTLEIGNSWVWKLALAFEVKVYSLGGLAEYNMLAVRFMGLEIMYLKYELQAITKI